MEEIVTDSWLDHRLQLRQLKQGHRAGTDAILLAAAITEDPGILTLDVGSGSGAAGLAVALRYPHTHLRLLENDTLVANLAQENIDLNAMGARAKAIQVNILSSTACQEAGIKKGEASLVITNPPFFTAEQVRISPHNSRAKAHVLSAGSSLTAWINCSLSFLALQGRFTIIHRPDSLKEILISLDKSLGNIKVLPIYAHAGRPATRVLISGVKGSKASLTLSAGLILHEKSGQFTPEAAAIHRGQLIGKDIFSL